jgi:hypothetical protein
MRAIKTRAEICRAKSGIEFNLIYVYELSSTCGKEMLLTFVAILVFTFAFLQWRKTFGRRVWTVVVVLACMFSLFLAFVSLWNVWTPYPTSWDLGQSYDGEFEGFFPWSKLSYPLYLNVYHTPFNQLTFDQLSGTAHGQVRFSIFLANAKTIEVNGTFWYIYAVMGPEPLYYHIDFPLSSYAEPFFVFLLTLFTFFNIVGASLGIILARILHKTISK